MLQFVGVNLQVHTDKIVYQILPKIFVEYVENRTQSNYMSAVT